MLIIAHGGKHVEYIVRGRTVIEVSHGAKILNILEEYDICQLDRCKTRRWAYVNPYDPTSYDYNDSPNITTTPIDDYQVTLTERGLANLADDVEEYRDMRQFMRGNPQIRYEFEKWQTLELLRRA
jgi:hypothetical protein